ncbi:MAG: pectinesterase family protein [Bacteroidota bacterium]
MKKIIILIAMLWLTNFVFGTIILVDQNGAGQYSSIQAAINVANTSDTVRVWPGIYQEQITMSKNITLQGSGFENTVITGTFNPTITISYGQISWFRISSLSGDGISMSGGTVKNCIVNNCANCGISSNSGNGNVINCILNNNGQIGISQCHGIINVTNCIAINNGSYGFRRGDQYCSGAINLSYSCGSALYTTGNIGCFNTDPFFLSDNDYHISEGSPCWNLGNPSLNDPDGSHSDIGYYGGPDCPIYPVVYEIQITPNGSTIDLQAKGRANY